MIPDIQNKIGELIKSADQLLKNSAGIAQNRDFGLAISLQVTAFEERTKAVVLQIVDLGLPLVNNFNELEYIFRQHDARHYIGFFIDCLYEVINDTKVILEKCTQDKNYRNKILNFSNHIEVQQEFLNWTLLKIDSFIHKVDFYQNIEKTRQNGLYVDIFNRKYKDNKLSEEDFLHVKFRLNNVHLLSKDLIEMKQLYYSDILPALENSKQQMDQYNIPEKLVQAIQLIKKKRSKLFNSIRLTLEELQSEFLDHNQSLD